MFTSAEINSRQDADAERNSRLEQLLVFSIDHPFHDIWHTRQPPSPPSRLPNHVLSHQWAGEKIPRKPTLLCGNMQPPQVAPDAIEDAPLCPILLRCALEKRSRARGKARKPLDELDSDPDFLIFDLMCFCPQDIPNSMCFSETRFCGHVHRERRKDHRMSVRIFPVPLPL